MIKKWFASFVKNNVRVRKGDFGIYLPEHKRTFELWVLQVWGLYYSPKHKFCVEFKTPEEAWAFIDSKESDNCLVDRTDEVYPPRPKK